MSMIYFSNMCLTLSVSVSVCFPVLGGQESRGVLRKISDMLEVIMKRMDALSKLGNTTDTHRLDELSSALDRYSFLVSDAVTAHVKGNLCIWMK